MMTKQGSSLPFISAGSDYTPLLSLLPLKFQHFAGMARNERYKTQSGIKSALPTLHGRFVLGHLADMTRVDSTL